VLDLYDEYCTGHHRASSWAAALIAGGLAMARRCCPATRGQTISFTDQRHQAKYVTYPSPAHLRHHARLPRAADRRGAFPSVLVVTRTAGSILIEDVARRAATRAFWPWHPTGSAGRRLPGNDDDGRTLQAGLDQSKLRTDMVNSARVLKAHALSTGKLASPASAGAASTTNFLAAEPGRT